MKFRLTFSNGFLAENPWCDGEPVELETEPGDWAKLSVSERETILRHGRNGIVVVQKGDRFDGILNLEFLVDMAARGFELDAEREKARREWREAWATITAPPPPLWRRFLTRIRRLFPFWE